MEPGPPTGPGQPGQPGQQPTPQPGPESVPRPGLPSDGPQPPRPDLTQPRPDLFPPVVGYVRPADRPPPPGPWGMAVTWGFWESLLLGIVGFMIGGLVFSLPVVATARNGDLTDTQFALVAILGEVGSFVTVTAWLYIRHRRSAKALAVNFHKPVDAAIGFGMGLVLYFVAVVGIAQVIALLLDRFTGHTVEAPDQLPTTLSGLALVLTGFAVIVCAPIAEELLFRGMLFRSLRDRHGFWPGALVSSALFGAVHIQDASWEPNVLLTTTLAFVGFGLCLLYEWRKNLLTNIAAHCAFNVVGFAFFVSTNGFVHLW